MRYLRSLIPAVLTFQIAFGPAAVLFGSANSLAEERTQVPVGNEQLKNSGPYADDPIMQQLVNSTSSGLRLPYSRQESSLDQDPFFLRSQNWTASDSRSDSESNLTFKKVSQGVDIGLPNSGKVLHLNAPLTPVHATEEFIFLTLDASSDLFQKAGGSDGPGEGLFFISRSDLSVQSATSNSPVPVFFLPLPGQGWKGQVDSYEFPEADMLAIVNSENTAISLEIKDVEAIMKSERINLMLASAFTAKNHGVSGDSASRGGVIFPAAGMTALFGTFFTGIDFQSPSASLWASNDQFKGTEIFSYVVEQAKAKWGWINILGSTQADAAMTPELIQHLVYVGSILTGMMALSVVLKYANPALRQKIKDMKGPVPTAPLARLRRESTDVLDVFAHITTTASQIPSVAFANMTELFLDKLMPAQAAAEHTVIRRILRNTFFFARDSIKATPVNAKTFMLGAVVMGTVDTASVVVQYEVAVPLLCAAVKPELTPYLQHKVDATFDPGNPNTASLAENDSIRNGLAYAQRGASGYSADSKAQVIEAIQSDIDGQMRANGKDPLAPENQAERERLTAARVDQALQQRGLPPSDRFLFDANSLYANAARTLGYGSPDNLRQDESYILAKRFGLTRNAINRAIDIATKDANAGHSEALAAIAILQETAKNMSFVRGAVGQGAQGLKAARKVRQELTLLSYEGPVDWAVRYIPESWSSQASPEAAKAAGLYFRQALYSYLLRGGEAYLKTTQASDGEDVSKAKSKAIADMKVAHPELASLSPSQLAKSLAIQYAYELQMRTRLEMASLARQRAEQAASIQSTDLAKSPALKSDWLARRQHMHAEKYASEKLGAMSEPADQASRDQLFKSFYRDDLARQVGLRVEEPGAVSPAYAETYKSMLAAAERQASDMTDGQIQNDPVISRVWSDLNPYDRLRVQSSLNATNFLQAYKHGAADGHSIPAIAPQQLGRFQSIRQTKWVRENQSVTRAIRFVEAFMSDDSFKPGIQAMLSRNIPLYSDLWTTHMRSLKTIIPAMTITFAFNYYGWGVHLHYGTALLAQMLAAATIMTPSQWLNRVFQMNGLKAMDGVMSKIAYSLPYAWVTFFGMIPLMMFSSDANHLMTDVVVDPIMSGLGQVSPEIWIASAAAATALIFRSKQREQDLRPKLEPHVNETHSSHAPLSCSALFLAH